MCTQTLFLGFRRYALEIFIFDTGMMQVSYRSDFAVSLFEFFHSVGKKLGGTTMCIFSSFHIGSRNTLTYVMIYGDQPLLHFKVAKTN